MTRHLPTALDEAAVAALFGATRCRIDRVKHRPGRNATVSYRLTAGGREQIVTTRWCRDGDACRRFERDTTGAARHFPDLDMIAWPWPADPKLDAPRVLADPARLAAAVAALGLGMPRAVQAEVVQYVPESRLTARVVAQVAGEARTLYAKASREPSGAEAHALLAALHGQAGLVLPRPLGWQPETGLFWQDEVPGIAWLDLPPAAQRRLAPALGAQLARLHAARVPQARAADRLHARLDTALALLADALPAERGLLPALHARLAAGIDDWCGAPAVLLHADLHPRNVLVDGDRVALIDLDGARLGPAVLELGAWRADALYRAELAGGADDRAAWLALLEGYAAAGGRLPHGPALAWACAWNLVVQRAWRCLVNLKPGRPAVAPRLVARAASIARAQDLAAA